MPRHVEQLLVERDATAKVKGSSEDLCNMTEVKLFFKLVDTGNFVSDPKDSYSTQTDQLIYDLKTNASSYYGLRDVTPLWLLKLGSDSGTILDNAQTIDYYKLKNDDVLYLQDPELAKVSYSDNGQTKSLWAKKSDTISTLKQKAFPGKTDDFSFGFKRAETKVDDNSTVRSLFDNLSLDIIHPPKTILPGITEGEYRLRNLNYYIKFSSTTIEVDLTTKDNEATYFQFDLDKPLSSGSAQIGISYLSRVWAWYGTNYRKPGLGTTLSFMAFPFPCITLKEMGTNTGYYNLLFSVPGDVCPQYLVVTNSGELKIDAYGNMSSVSRDWYLSRRS
ncbi:hypothetical protein CPB84DRAFT_1963538 [Gymnopilus junonius]|uniref:Uncharacterized protein n=1 Tax=Gymnopilus junonius TaxID=109634 RepID=A0A9P5TLD7_GYMJU|nr:hypothetical protein CPB84DRAFT_1963538 [Gymnopilus junonius]